MSNNRNLMIIVKISTALLFILLAYFLIAIFSVKSNDIDSYLLGYEIFLNTKTIFDKGVWITPYADFNLLLFYIKDHAYFNIIHLLKEKTGLSIRDAFYFYSSTHIHYYNQQPLYFFFLS